MTDEEQGREVRALCEQVVTVIAGRNPDIAFRALGLAMSIILSHIGPHHPAEAREMTADAVRLLQKHCAKATGQAEPH